MAGKLQDAHLTYLMGHKPNSAHAKTTYQVPDHHVSSSGLRFDESLDTSVGDFHSSVACGRGQKNLLSVEDEVLYGSRTMSILIKTFKEADAQVFQKHRVSSFDLEVRSRTT
jgi:hypothetical protein